MGNTVALITGIILLGGAFWITRVNSPRHACVLLAIAAASITTAQIKGIEMFSLLGIPAILGVMVASRFAREKSITRWLAAHHFTPAVFEQAPALFPSLIHPGQVSYASYNVRIAGIPCLFSERRHTYRSGNIASLVLHCTYYFDEKTGTQALKKQLQAQKEITPADNWFKSQLGYFGLQDAEIFEPAMGGLAVCWRLPATITGYQERYLWMKRALEK